MNNQSRILKLGVRSSKLGLGLLSSIFYLLSSHAQTSVLFPLAQMTGTTNDTTITIKAVNNPVSWHSNIYWFPTTGIKLATLNGSATTNLIPNDYNVTIAGVPGSWKISVNDTNVTLNAALIGNLSTYAFTLPLPGVLQILPGIGITVSPTGGQGAVTINATGAGGAATNVYQTQTASTRLTITTNLGTLTYTLDVPANAFDAFGAAAAVQTFATGVSNLWNSGSNNLQTAITGNTTAIGTNSASIESVAASVPVLALSASNQLFFNLGSPVIITNGASDATIQAIFNANTNNGVIAFQPGAEFNLSSKFSWTNGGFIDGRGAVLHWTNAAALGLSGAIIDTGTNLNKALIVRDLKFDGGVYSAYNSATYFNTLNGSYDPYYDVHWTNRTGMRLECSGGVRLFNCTFAGWSGSGLLLINIHGNGAQMFPKSGAFNCHFQTNFIGGFSVGEDYQVPGFNNAPSALWAPFDAEYFQFQGCTAAGCQHAVIASGANGIVDGCDLSGNYTPLYVGTGLDNGGHGSYAHNNFNHSTHAAWFEVTQGGDFGDNMCLAASDIVFSGVNLMNVHDCEFGSANLFFTNGCTGKFIDNSFDAGDVWGVSFTTNFSSGVLIGGNFDATAQNSDGYPLSLEMQRNGILLTNLPLAAISTNAGQNGQIATVGSDGMAHWSNAPAGSGGSGTVTSVNAAQQGYTSSGAVTTSGTVTLTRSGTRDDLNFGDTNEAWISMDQWTTITNPANHDFVRTNTAVVGTYFLHHTNGSIFNSGNFTNAGQLFEDTIRPNISGTVTVQGNTVLNGTVEAGNTLTLDNGISGSGAGLTGLNASQLSSGTVPMARLGATVVTNIGTLATTVVRGDGAGGITNATAGVDYVAPWMTYTNFLAATNLNIVFDGMTHRGTITNGPDVFFNWSGSNGSWSFQVYTQATIHSTTTFNKFLSGSNGVATGVYKITNGIFSVSSYGGTNGTQLVPAIGELQ